MSIKVWEKRIDDLERDRALLEAHLEETKSELATVRKELASTIHERNSLESKLCKLDVDLEAANARVGRMRDALEYIAAGHTPALKSLYQHIKHKAIEALKEDPTALDSGEGKA